MTATLEQTQQEMPRLLELVSQGEEIVITVHGQPVARLTGLPRRTSSGAGLEPWLVKLDRLRARTHTGKAGPTAEELLGEDRGD